MKMISFSRGLLLALSFAATAQAVCSSNLLIDDYSDYLEHKNSLGRYTSDDGTTKDLTVDVVNKKIAFNATTGSYFYTNFDCENAAALGYNAFTFPIRSVAGASFLVELHTSKFCPIDAYTIYDYLVPTKMTGSMLIITVPLNVFVGANLSALNSLVFGGFTPGIWEIGATQLVCANSQSNSVHGSTTSSSSKSSITATTSSTSSMATAAASNMLSNSSSTATSSTASSLSSSTGSTSTNSTMRASTSSSKTTTFSAPLGTCTSLLIDDFASPLRLLSQHLNSLLQPSCDDSKMRSVTVANDHVTLTPIDTKSYFYTSFGCLKASNIYGGISIKISTQVHTVITFELWTSKACTTDNPTIISVTSTKLGWKFDGTEQTYTIPFTAFPELDTDHLISIRLLGFRNAVTLGHIALCCRYIGAYGS